MKTFLANLGTQLYDNNCRAIDMKSSLHILVLGNAELGNTDPVPLTKRAIRVALAPFAALDELPARHELMPINGTSKVFKTVLMTIGSVYWTFMVLKKILRFKADVLIVPYVDSAGLISAIVATVLRKRSVLQAVGSDLKISTRSFLPRCIVSSALKFASGTICVSKDLERIAKSLGARRTIVILPPTDLPPSFKERNVQENMIISVANLFPVKGMSFLVKAMQRIPMAKLVIIGDGPEKKNLESLTVDLGIEDRVLFLGSIRHGPEFWDWLRRASVFVLPSLSEGFPRTIIEAMACGLPIVATSVGGIPDIVENQINGLIVPPKNERLLADAVVKVLDSKPFREKASEINKTAATKYSIDIIGKEIYDYLLTL
jgi:glycosyltransferase involved in cell wall biosynthesis